MRYCYEHREEIWARGKACAEWMRREWTWLRPARQLIDAIDKQSGL
jgi:hypothetical protein